MPGSTDLLQIGRSNTMVLDRDLAPCDLTLWTACANHASLAVLPWLKLMLGMLNIFMQSEAGQGI